MLLFAVQRRAILDVRGVVANQIEIHIFAVMGIAPTTKLLDFVDIKSSSTCYINF
jgi:hypothetical protein